MRIAEIFHSIQGEGMLTGVPSVFVRTSGCNLRCAWCDTPYASWQPEGDEWSLEAIRAEVDRFSPTRHVVVTGGEPMVAKGMPALLAALRGAGRHLTIETAATISPGGVACDLASLSPKLANSTPDAARAGSWAVRHESTRRQPAVIREWLAAYECQLKFVVGSPADIAEIDALLAELGVPVAPERILLMPEGTDAATLRDRAGWVVELCKQRGFRFCQRLHVDLFGHTRGT